eukprot:scaffold9934_cov48-Cyclotella_meneghiniana.AAC.9
MKRALMNRRLSNEGRESDSFKSETEEILDLPYVEPLSSSRRDAVIPSINDVLIVDGPGAFDYIGNRRYRVLIESNFNSYFDLDADDARRREIVDGIISSVEGNEPRGRFLVPKQQTNCKFIAIHEYLHSIKWKRATREEAEAKVHFTFLSAGKFLVYQAEEMDGKIDEQIAPASMQDDVGNVADASQQKIVENKKQRVATSPVERVGAASHQHEMVYATKKHVFPSSVQSVDGKEADSQGMVKRTKQQIIPPPVPPSLCDSSMRGINSKVLQDSSMQDVAAALKEMNKKMEQKVNVDETALQMKTETEQQVDTSRIVHVGVDNNDLENTSMNSITSSLSQDYSQDSIDIPSTVSSIQCPARIRDFVNKPIDNYFVLTSPNLSYNIPSKYDILCGSGNHFFHHIGNRRFRIRVEMKIHKYQALMKPCSLGRNDSAIDDLVRATVRSLIGCKPSARFLGMDFLTGQWRVLDSNFAFLKTEQTFFECMKVMEYRRRKMLQQDAELLGMAAIENEPLDVPMEEETLSAASCAPCNVPPYPSFGLDMVMMQSQAMPDLCDARDEEKTKLATEILSKASALPCRVPPRPSVGVAMAMMQTQAMRDLCDKEKTNMSTEVMSKASVLPYNGPPRPSSGVAEAIMQTQAMRELCGAPAGEKTKLSSETLSTASVTPCNGQSYPSVGVGAAMMRTQAMHTESFLQHMRASKDILDVVGGMLSLGKKSSK